MEVLVENIISYLLIFIIIASAIIIYFKRISRKSRINIEKIKKAKDLGLYEPVSLHPVVDADTCIGSGACIEACPEKDVLGLVNGRAQTINASRCVGHGACFHACPVEAITLVMGTEQRGVELPHVSPEFESNIPGLFIAGELGGMGLIKNAVEQGKQAMENIIKKYCSVRKGEYDVIIVGAGPSGISATLTAAKNNLKFLTLEQDSLGGAVFNFPRAKVVMTSPMEIPLYGKLKLSETTKSELLGLWKNVLLKNNILINEQEKVEIIQKAENHFEVKTSRCTYSAGAVLLTIGRRGSPRKLSVPGEDKEKVSYRLLEPEVIHDKKILIVGGGDSAVESAFLLADEGNEVALSYRGSSFSRLKEKNREKIEEFIYKGVIKVFFTSNVIEIKDNSVLLLIDNSPHELENDLVYIFAGGELPTQFLERTGIKITKKFGEAVLKHLK